MRHHQPEIRDVRNYLQNSWNINIDELRESVLRRADEVPDMDLESLDD